MGESSFWYRSTWVVPDQRPLNGHCGCCCRYPTAYNLCDTESFLDSYVHPSVHVFRKKYVYGIGIDHVTCDL